MPAFRWFNKHLKRQEPLIGMAAEKLLTPAELKVFAKLPEDEPQHDDPRDLHAHHAAGGRRPPTKRRGGRAARGGSAALRTKVFRGWPEEDPP